MITTAKLFEIIGRQYVATLELSEREDDLIKKHEEKLKEKEDRGDFWYEQYLKEKDRAEDLEKRLEVMIDELKEEEKTALYADENEVVVAEAEGADW